MKTYRGGERMPRGAYMNLTSGDFFQSPEEGAVLPGGSEKRYLRVPAPLLLLAGPLMGLGFVIFLPFVGIVGLLAFAAGWLARFAQRVLEEAAQAVVPSWVPGVSYLTRGHRVKEERRPEAWKSHPEAIDRVLGELERGLRERRGRGEE